MVEHIQDELPVESRSDGGAVSSAGREPGQRHREQKEHQIADHIVRYRAEDRLVADQHRIEDPAPRPCDVDSQKDTDRKRQQQRYADDQECPGKRASDDTDDIPLVRHAGSQIPCHNACDIVEEPLSHRDIRVIVQYGLGTYVCDIILQILLLLNRGRHQIHRIARHTLDDKKHDDQCGKYSEK